MINYVSGYEYSGVNAGILASAGVDAVVTFKQAVKDLGVPGKKLKGLKSCATLIRFSKSEKVENEEGKTVPKPIYFSVFDASEVLKRK